MNNIMGLAEKPIFQRGSTLTYGKENEDVRMGNLEKEKKLLKQTTKVYKDKIKKLLLSE